MDQTTLEFQEAKRVRLETCLGTAESTNEIQRLASAIGKTVRRIGRIKDAQCEKAVKVEKEQNKLTQEQKAQKKKDYERQRKDRYKGKEK